MQDGQALQKRENVPVSIPIFVNGYLTTPGQPAHEVWGMIEDLGFKVEVGYQQAAEKSPSFVLSRSAEHDKLQRCSLNS